MKLIILLTLIPFLGFSQKQIGVPYEKPCPYGYLEYLPACETLTENCRTVYKCPDKLLISLEGFGERGNGTTDLYRVSNAGLARLIKDGQWSRKDFIVISPQLFTGQNMYSPRTLNAFIKQMIFKYKVDSSEVYLAGLSAGANSIYPYIAAYKGIRAAVAISGYGASKLAVPAMQNGTKIWEFHGEIDDVVPYSMFFHKAYVNAEPVPTDNVKFTGWPEVGHTGWQEVLSGKWRDKTSINDPFDRDVFDWMIE